MKQSYTVVCLVAILSALVAGVVATTATTRYSFEQTADLKGWSFESSASPAATSTFDVRQAVADSTDASTKYLAVSTDSLPEVVGVEHRIVSPVLTTGEQRALHLGYTHYFQHQHHATSHSQSAGRVDVFDGAVWQPVQRFGGASNADGSVGSASEPVRESVDVSQYANPSMRVRFVLARVAAHAAAAGRSTGSWNINDIALGQKESVGRSLLQIGGGEFMGGPIVGGVVGNDRDVGFQFTPASTPMAGSPGMMHTDKHFALGSGRYLYVPLAAGANMVGSGSGMAHPARGKYMFVPAVGTGMYDASSGTGAFTPGVEFIPGSGTGKYSTPALVIGHDSKGMPMKYNIGRDRDPVKFQAQSGTGGFLKLADQRSSGSGAFFFVPGSAAATGLDGRFYAPGTGEKELGFEFIPGSGSGGAAVFPRINKQQARTFPNMGSADYKPLRFMAGSGTGMGSGGAFFLPASGSANSGSGNQGFYFIPGTGSGSSGGHWFTQGSASGDSKHMTEAHLGFEFVPQSGTGHGAKLHFPHVTPHSHMPKMGSASVDPMLFFKGSGSGMGSGGVFWQPSTGSGTAGFYFVPGTGSGSGMDLGHWFTQGTGGTGKLGMEFQPMSGTGHGAHLRFPQADKQMVWPGKVKGSGVAQWIAGSGSGSGGSAGYFFLPASGGASGQGFYFQQSSGSGMGSGSARQTGKWFMQSRDNTGSGFHKGLAFQPFLDSGSGSGGLLHFPKLGSGLNEQSQAASPQHMTNIREAMYGSAQAPPAMFTVGTGMGALKEGYWYIPGPASKTGPAPNGYFFVAEAAGSGSGMNPNAQGKYYLPKDNWAWGSAMGSGGDPFGSEFFPRTNQLQFPAGSGNGFGSGGGFDISVPDFFNGVALPTPPPTPPTPTTPTPTPTPTPGGTPTPVPPPQPACKPTLRCAGSDNIGDCTKELLRGSVFRLQVTASREGENCEQNTQPISFTWRSTPQLPGGLDSTSSASSVLRVLPFTTQAGRTYEFIATARIGQETTEQRFNVVIGRSPLQSQIGCGSAISASGLAEIVLNASGTVDNDVGPTDSQPAYAYDWSCVNAATGQQCLSNAATSLNRPLSELLLKTPVVTLAPGTLAVGTYVFTLVVSGTNGDSRSSTTSQTVKITPGGAAAGGVTICVTGVARINPTSVLRLRANPSQESDWSYNWTSETNQAGTEIEIDDASVQNLVVGGNRDFVQGQAASAFFAAGATYTFSVVARNSANTEVGASWQVEVNSAPAGGRVTVSPAVGEGAPPRSTIDAITLMTSSWVDANNDNPIVYQFYRRTLFGDVIELNLPSDVATFTTKSIPFGDPANGYTVTIGVRATDYLGLSATNEIDIVVEPRGGKTVAEDTALFNQAGAELNQFKDEQAFHNTIMVVIRNLSSEASTQASVTLKNRMASAYSQIAALSASNTMNFAKELARGTDLQSQTLQTVLELISTIPQRVLSGEDATVQLGPVIADMFGVIENVLASVTATDATSEQALVVIEGMFEVVNKAGEDVFRDAQEFTTMTKAITAMRSRSESTKMWTQAFGEITVEIAANSFEVSAKESIDVNAVVFTNPPFRSNALLSKMGLFMEVSSASQDLLDFVPGSVTVTLPYDTAKAGNNVPQCVVWGLATDSWTTSGIKTGVRDPVAGTITCHPEVSSVQIAVVSTSGFEQPPRADGAIRVRMQLATTPVGVDLNSHLEDVQSALETATDAAASDKQFQMITASNVQSGSYTYFDIVQGGQPPLAIFLDLQLQSGQGEEPTLSPLRAIGITSDTDENSFMRQCADGEYRLECTNDNNNGNNNNKSSSDDDDDAGVIVGVTVGAVIGVAGIAGALWYANKEKKGADESAPSASPPAAEPLVTDDPASTAATGDSAV